MPPSYDHLPSFERKEIINCYVIVDFSSNYPPHFPLFSTHTWRENLTFKCDFTISVSLLLAADSVSVCSVLFFSIVK